MELRPVAPPNYAALLPLLPDAPPTLIARALLLAGRDEIRVCADDPAQPAFVAVEWQTAAGHTLTLAGDAMHPALPAYLHTLRGPLTLHAPAALAGRLAALRPDLAPRPMATFTPSLGAEAAFSALPPGGVRRLRPNDARHLAPFPAWLWGAYGSPERASRDGIVYARYLRAEIVSLAATVGRTERYDAIGAYTIARARRNGFARECAARLIAAVVTERGTQPMWTCAADDAPTVALAASLGLTAAQPWTAYVL